MSQYTSHLRLEKQVGAENEQVSTNTPRAELGDTTTRVVVS